MFRGLKRLSAREEARADHGGGERTKKTCKEVSRTGEGILDRMDAVYIDDIYSQLTVIGIYTAKKKLLPNVFIQT